MVVVVATTRGKIILYYTSMSHFNYKVCQEMSFSKKSVGSKVGHSGGRPKGTGASDGYWCQ